MVYYEPIKLTIDIPELAKVIFNVIIQYYSLFNLIISNRGLLFIFKFISLLCYFFGIKYRLLTVFYP